MEDIKLIPLTESQRSVLVNHYTNEQEEIAKKIQELSDQFSENSALIDQLLGNERDADKYQKIDAEETVNPDEEDGEYNTSWSVWKKVEFILNSSPKSLLAKEIVDIMIKNDPTIAGDDKSRRKVSIGVFASLNTKYNAGALSRRKGVDGFRYQMIKRTTS